MIYPSFISVLRRQVLTEYVVRNLCLCRLPKQAVMIQHISCYPKQDVYATYRVCAAAAMLPIINLAGSMLTACTCRLVYLSCHVPTVSTVVLLVTWECECSGLIASPQE